MRGTYIFKIKDYKKVITYFINNNDNRTSTISKKLKFNLEYVSYLIDIYLSRKRNYKSDKIDYKPKNDTRGKHLYVPIIVKDYLGYEIGTYRNIVDAAKVLNVNSQVISKKLINNKIVEIYHSKIKKTYIYEKI